MKTFCKTKILPLLLVAITALCAFFGAILTTPINTYADEPVSQGTVEKVEALVDVSIYGKILVLPDSEDLAPSGFSINGFMFDVQGGSNITALCDQYDGKMALLQNPFEYTSGYWTLPTGEVVSACAYDFTKDILLEDIEETDLETNEITYSDMLLNESTMNFMLYDENLPVYLYTPGAEVPEEPTEETQEDEKPGFILDDVADWFNNAGDDVAGWLNDNGININGRGVLVAGFVIILLVGLFKRKRR